MSEDATTSTPLRPVAVVACDLMALIVTVSLVVSAQVGVSGIPRLVLALAFVTFVPGWALLDHVALVADGTSRVAVAIALSLTIAVTGSLALVWLHRWHPLVLLDALGALSGVAIAAHLASVAQTAFAAPHPNDPACNREVP